MSCTISPSSNKPYGVARVTSVWSLARSSFYAARQRVQRPREPQKRGPKVLSDEELIIEIRQLLAEPGFTGEGYRKIWARLRHKGIRTSKDRVLRLLREHQLLSAARQPEPTRSNPHEGTIVTQAPNLEELRIAVRDFRNRYNNNWIVERLGYRTPVQARLDLCLELQAIA